MRIVVGAGTVDLDAAAPAVGFTMDVLEEGPDLVIVTFRSEDHESRFEADWGTGVLRIDITEGAL